MTNFGNLMTTISTPNTKNDNWNNNKVIQKYKQLIKLTKANWKTKMKI